MATVPVFLFSLPRSGSTLLQRMLACHENIKTESELWFLLPHIDAIHNKYSLSKYSTLSLSNATRGLVDRLPNGEKDYYEAVRALGDHIYNKLAVSNERYVLDKTPRYYLIIEEIRKVYPDAKFIFLLRNPLAVAASVIESFNRGRLGDFRHRIDLYLGPEMLAKACKSLGDQCMAVHYEDLLLDPSSTLEKICEYLEIPFRPQMVTDFSSIPVGKLGDQFGSNVYTSIEQDRAANWKRVFSTTYRRKYLVGYLEYLGKETVQFLGYDYDALMAEIEGMDVTFSLGLNDRYNRIRGIAWSVLEGMLFRQKILNYKNEHGKFFLLH